MMMKAFAAAALCGALLLPLRVTAADPGQTTIYSTGQATVSAPPDVAVVSFSIASHASTAEQATGLSNTVYAHLTTGMRTIGIAAADTKTTSYTLNHVPPPPPCPPPVQPQARAPNAILLQETPCVRDPQTWGYFVNRSVTVTVHHLDLVGKIIDTAVAAGVNNVQGVDYSIADTRSLFLRALGQAIASARNEGDAMARAAGLHIVRIQSINNSEAVPVRFSAGRFMPSPAADTYAVPTQISPPSSLDVSANVSVVYLAQP
ncbi:MAG TPA: SIMPL domain-containing protein [Candidatus Rubrimentiphilum sp.]|nr:SIMPL domain-containing protein [Candidatus Rubrimentiphilum sp.]